MLSLPSSYTTPMQYYFGFCVYSQRSFKQSNTRYIFFCLIFLSALLRYNLHAVNDMFNLHTFITSDLKTHSWNHLQIKSENIHHLSKLHCSPLFLSLAQPYLCPQATTNLLLLWISLYFLEKAMAPHSSTLAWRIPWMEEPGRLQSVGSLRVRHDWVTSLWLFTFMHWRRKWQPTPVFLPGESPEWGSLVGCLLWGRKGRTPLKQLSSSSSLYFPEFYIKGHTTYIIFFWLLPLSIIICTSSMMISSSMMIYVCFF